MAYGVKYRFRLESVHGIQYTVNLSEDGYSGSVTVRPLGGAPVIHMQDSDPFRATSCDLVLECRTDGEFGQLYTSNPRQFRVDVYRGGALDGSGGVRVWTGYVATELYSEPDIAPPYDVSITATDGLGTLKEYDFPERGLQTVRNQLQYLLARTGLSLSLQVCWSIGPVSGTPSDMLDGVSINMDYMVGKTCYDVLKELLTSFHLTLTQHRGAWVAIRETDISGKLNSSDALSVLQCSTQGATAISSTTIPVARRSIGKMGVSGTHFWPVGHMTRRTVPAKYAVTVEAPWHMADDNSVEDWDPYEIATWHSDKKYYDLGVHYYMGNDPGTITMDIPCRRFTSNLKVVIRVASSYASARVSSATLLVSAEKTSDGSVLYWHDSETNATGWTSTSPAAGTRHSYSIMDGEDPDVTKEFTFEVPPPPINEECTIHLSLTCFNTHVFSIITTTVIGKGYRDTILLDNSARGRASDVVISGGRLQYDSIMSPAFYRGVFLWATSPDTPVFSFADNRNYGKDFLSITALDYALSVALPRIELTGVLDFPTNQSYIPLVVKLRGTDYLVKSYDFDLLNEELSFSAITLPAASLSVESETVVSTGAAD